MKFICLIIFLFSTLFTVHAQDSLHVLYGKATYYHKRFEGRKTSNGEKFRHKNFTCANNTLPMNTFLKVENLDNNKTTVLRVNDRLPKKSKVLLDLTYTAAMELDFVRKGSANIRVQILDTSSVHDSLLVLFAEAVKGMKVRRSKQKMLSDDRSLLAENKSKTEKLIKKTIIQTDSVEINKIVAANQAVSDNQNNASGGFGIQVLSYNSKQKAQQTADALEKKYNETVSVRSKEIKGKMFYRVVIGQFNSKSDLVAVKNKIEKDYKDCYAMKLD